MAKRRSSEDRREQKQAVLIDRTARVMSVTLAEAERYLRTPLVQSVRFNPLNGDPDMTFQSMKELGWQGSGSTFGREYYTIESGREALRDSLLVESGKIYIQNASSWLPVIALDPKHGEKVLDVCAAPGGKTSHIAALQNNGGDIMANDNSRPRLAKLRSNLDRLGVHAEYTLYDATRLTKYIAADSFDKILLDAPCSGEGLINLDQPKSLDSWSVAHIRRLATMQKRLIDQAWQLLKPGGILVYSTCTMAPEEDEAVIDYLLRKHSDVEVEPLPFTLDTPLKAWNEKSFDQRVSRAGRVFPGSGDEAFFVCKLRKTTSDQIV